MTSNSQNSYKDLGKLLNNTNFTNHDHIKLFYKLIILNVYDQAYEENKRHLTILITILLVFSIIGTITNLTAILIFKLIFNKSLNRNIRSKLSVSTISSVDIKDDELKFDYNSQYRTKVLYKKYIETKKNLVFNSNLRLFYTLICYLAMIDLFTCLFSIPVTAFEIKANMKIAEFYCKLFEFMRSSGVIASNFLIILISIERYKSLNAIGMLKMKFYNIRLVLIFFITFLIGIICMLQVSIYQKIDGVKALVEVGICLKSEQLITKWLSKVICILITAILVFNLLCVSSVYFLFFKKTNQLKKKQSVKKKLEMDVFQRVITNISENQESSCGGEAFINLKNKITANQMRIPFYLNRNFRVACIIITITCTHYMSIIPWCLTITGLIAYNPYIHYTFLLNSILNPLIYGFFNPNFRNSGFYLLKLLLISIFKN